MSAKRVSIKSEPRSGELSLKPVGLLETSPDSVFPMFASGASLGGLATFEAIFCSLPPDTDQQITRDGVRIDHLSLDQRGRGDLCDCHDGAG